MKDIVTEINSPHLVIRFSTIFEEKKCRLQFIAKETYFVTTDFEHCSLEVLITETILKDYLEHLPFIFLCKFINCDETQALSKVYTEATLFGVPLSKLCDDKLDRETFNEIHQKTPITPLTIFEELRKLFRGYFSF